MSDNSRYYKLSAVVDQWLIDNDLTSGFFPKGLSWAIRGLRELNLDSWNDVKTVLLDVTDKKTVVLPDDYVSWTLVGTQWNQYVIALGVNGDLNTLGRTTSSPHGGGLPSDFSPWGIDFSSYAPIEFSNFGGGSVSAICGRHTNKGFFKVKDNGQCKELLIDYDYGFKQVYLEYISDGFDPCGETTIHPYTYDYIIKYMDNMYEKKNNPKATGASIERSAYDLAWAEKRLRSRNNNLDPQTLLNIVRQNTTLSVRL